MNNPVALVPLVGSKFTNTSSTITGSRSERWPSTRTRPNRSANRASAALRLAANALHRSDSALGYAAIRAGHTVRFVHADDFFRAMTQARVDNSTDRAFRSFLTPDLLILDGLGLHGLTAQQSADLYELILNRHRASSFVITSNRAVDEWLSLFDDPILGNSALDRLANASYQIVIEGTSYRERLSPHRVLLGTKGGD